MMDVLAKYWTAYKLALQEAFQLRWSLAMDRVRGLALMLSLYFLWVSLLKTQGSFLGYSRAQMLTYVLGMSLLRALVLSGKGWELIQEISSGKLSSYLLRPIDYFAFHFSRELAAKTLLGLSAIVEIAVLVALFRAPLYWPSLSAALGALVLAAGAMVLYAELSLLVCSAAFWTSESIGPLFLFELILQFAAGAFFPLDVLPASVQAGLRLTPFPYLVYVPLETYLERGPAIGPSLAIACIWIVALYAALRSVWSVGLRDYAAEGG
jgi:ABC-2 type transport system permease protein